MAAAPQLAKPSSYNPIINAALFGVIFLLILLRCMYTIDPDFGWHLVSGQYILASGLPSTDIFTYTAPNFPWIHHEWLADVITALLFNIGGYALVAVFFTTLWTFAIFFMAGNKHSLKSALAIIISVLAILQFIAIRDMAWTALLLAITHRLFTKHRAYLPLLFIAWANLHGGFMVGLVYLAWRLFYERNWRDSWIVPLSVAATLINPYGVLLYREIFATLLDQTLHTKIYEWQRLGIDASMAALIILWLSAVSYALFNKQWRGIIKFDTFLLAASFLSLRHFVLFGLMSIPRVAWFAGNFNLPTKHTNSQLFSKKHIIKIAAMQLSGYALLVFAAISAAVALQSPLKLNAEHNQPADATASLRVTPCKGNIFNHYDVGGYLIWKTPEQKVYIDGRMPSWELDGKNYMDNYLRVMENEEFQKQQFNTYHILCAVVPGDSQITKSLQQQGWQSETNNTNNWVLLRK